MYSYTKQTYKVWVYFGGIPLTCNPRFNFMMLAFSLQVLGVNGSMHFSKFIILKTLLKWSSKE